MRDVTSIRDRLLAAMGFVASAAGVACAGPPSPSQMVVDSGDTDPGTLAPTDTAAVPDVTDGGSGVADTAVARKVAPDTLDVDDGSDTALEVDTPTIPDAYVDCGSGAKIMQFCLSAESAKAQAEHAPCMSKKCPEFGPDVGGDTNVPVKQCTVPYTGPLPPEGCPWPGAHVCEQVSNGWVVGNTCCYLRCSDCVCGRPFVVDSVRRIAQFTHDSAWTPLFHSALSAPTDAERALAAAWRADAQDEHASVASFHQFGLDLLALGAPPDLVRDAALAAADEVQHARMCLAIAQRLDGATAGPGTLDCSQSRATPDLVRAAVAAVREGCVGETMAAAVAQRAAALATDAGVTSTLQRVTDDEVRHAALAWRFVQWAMTADRHRVAPAVRGAFSEAFAAGPPADPRRAALAGVDDDVRHQWGRLTDAEFTAVVQSTLALVVAPCARRLLDNTSAPDKPAAQSTAA